MNANLQPLFSLQRGDSFILPPAVLEGFPKIDKMPQEFFFIKMDGMYAQVRFHDEEKTKKYAAAYYDEGSTFFCIAGSTPVEKTPPEEQSGNWKPGDIMRVNHGPDYNPYFFRVEEVDEKGVATKSTLI